VSVVETGVLGCTGLGMKGPLVEVVFLQARLLAGALAGLGSASRDQSRSLISRCSSCELLSRAASSALGTGCRVLHHGSRHPCIILAVPSRSQTE